MTRAFFALSFILIFLSACTQRLVCPAYQSAFIYDKDELRKKFSYFQEDSTPKILTASKNKYLIAEPTSYRKKIRSMQTIPMKPVNVALPDSFRIDDAGDDGVIPGAELDLAARSVIDSIYIEDVEDQDPKLSAEDSVYVISVDKELRLLKYNFPDSLVYDPATGKYVAETPKYVVTQITFNVEQDNYMWYLRDYLVLPDVRLAQQTNAEQKASKKAKKKGVFGFFKNLFKKKDKKTAADSTAVQAPVESDDDFDYVDEDEQTQAQPVPEEPQKKKGLFSFLKKKDKTAQPGGSVLPEDEPPAKKKKEKKPKKVKEEPKKDEEEEKKTDEDDGF
jgi:hypothetical protein